MARGGDLLFVYGTLLAGSETPANLWLERRSTPVGAATVPGRLIAISTDRGWYPALLPARHSGQTVSGMVLRVRLRGADRRWLDRYEGAEYRLTRCRVEPGGQRVRAYRWIAPIPRGARPIAHGDFLRWLAESGRQPYRELPPRHQLRARPFDQA